MKHMKIKILFCILSLIVSGGVAMAQDVPRMTLEELSAMLDNPDLVIIDVRSGRDWSASESKIKGAVREAPRKAASWADKYQKNKTIVIYCA